MLFTGVFSPETQLIRNVVSRIVVLLFDYVQKDNCSMTQLPLIECWQDWSVGSVATSDFFGLHFKLSAVSCELRFSNSLCFQNSNWPLIIDWFICDLQYAMISLSNSFSYSVLTLRTLAITLAHLILFGVVLNSFMEDILVHCHRFLSAFFLVPFC